MRATHIAPNMASCTSVSLRISFVASPNSDVGNCGSSTGSCRAPLKGFGVDIRHPFLGVLIKGALLFRIYILLRALSEVQACDVPF